MTFYLKPPRGEIHLEKITDLGIKRLKFLSKIRGKPLEELQDILAQNFDLTEAVVEDTPKDRVAHYVLKIVASAAEKEKHEKKNVILSQFREFLVEQELQLFSWRTSGLDPRTRHQSLIGLQRHMRQNLCRSRRLSRDLVHLLNAVSEIIDQGTLLNPSESVFDNDADGIQVPFALVPRLVSERLTVLTNGMANITKANVLPFLAIVFKNILLSSLDTFRMHEDQRYQAMRSEILSVFGREIVANDPAIDFNSPFPADLKAIQVQSQSADFPPCFAHVHQKLVRFHRLKHHARVGYTLFLKEIGLSQEEAARFWSWHYSRSGSVQDSGCCHSWQADQRRYLYSIRHLYGLEGSRKNYSGHSCSAIQGRDDTIGEQLVCPFESYDIEDLARILEKQDISEEDARRVLSITEASDPSGACKLYMKAKHKFPSEGCFEFRKPSQYYQLTINAS